MLTKTVKNLTLVQPDMEKTTLVGKIDWKRPGGRLTSFKDAWRDSKWAYKVVSQGLGWAWVQQPPRCKLFFQKTTPSLMQYQQELTNMKVIQPARSLKFQGRLFQVAKRDSTEKRTILDLSTLNEYIKCPTFKMTTTSDVRNSLQIGDYTTSVDIRDAFHHVPVHPIFSKFLGFILNRKKFIFRGMPNGLCIGPRVFTKLLKVVIQSLRLKGIKILAFIDDILLWAESAEICEQHTAIARKEFEKRGFLLNFQKSRFKASQKFDYLGLYWDTQNGTLSLLKRHRIATIKLVKGLIKKQAIFLKEFQALLGKINSTTLVDPPSKCLAKGWYRYLKYFTNRFKKPIPRTLRKSLTTWLRKHQLKTRIPLTPPHPSVEIFTDSSQDGWGYHSSLGHQNSGKWSLPFRHLHINLKELITVHIALKEIKVSRNSHVRINSDNMTTVYVIKRGGSTKSSLLNSWTYSILRLAQKRKIMISTVHIPGRYNVLADALSRTKVTQTEWKLDPITFHSLEKMLPGMEVDLFATRENAQLPSFVSPFRDPLAVATNALTQDWNQWSKIYLFPPPQTKVIHELLKKLRTFRGQALLVLPFWPVAPWFPQLTSICSQSSKISATLSQTIQGKTTTCTSSLAKSLRVRRYFGNTLGIDMETK